MGKEGERLKRVKRWKHAAKLVAKSSCEVNREFQHHSRLGVMISKRRRSV